MLYLFSEERCDRIMQTYVVQSLTEYVKLMERIGSGNAEKWYRGQSNCEYRLLPSAIRNTYAIEDQRGYKIEPPYSDNPCRGSNNLLAYLPVDRMIREFKEKAKEQLSKAGIEESRRAESLTLQDFIKLYEVYANERNS